MNREIKFRVWDGDNSEGNTMHYTTALNVYENCLVAGFKFMFPHYQNNDGKAIMQFTGMKDKDGKEIYEGDILVIGAPKFGYLRNLNNEYIKYQVIFQRCEYMLSRTGNGVIWGRLSRIQELIYECQIVGNIYENPELLHNP